MTQEVDKTFLFLTVWRREISVATSNSSMPCTNQVSKVGNFVSAERCGAVHTKNEIGVGVRTFWKTPQTSQGHASRNVASKESVQRAPQRVHLYIINSRAHSPRTCWHPRCPSRKLSRNNNMAWLPVCVQQTAPSSTYEGRTASRKTPELETRTLASSKIESKKAKKNELPTP
jgi:hypothetical protein